MLFKRSCRGFLALLCLFLLVVQVVAVPPKAKSSRFKKSFGSLFKTLAVKNLLHKARVSLHSKARFAHTKAHQEASAAAWHHQVYAKSVSGAERVSHNLAAERYKKDAADHLTSVRSHGIEEGLRHGQSAQEAQESIRQGHSGHQNALLGHSLMVAAQEHRKTAAAHAQAATIAHGRGHQVVRNLHFNLRASHSQQASAHAKHALEHSQGMPTESTQANIHNDIAAAQKSADDARAWRKMAEVTINHQDHPPN
ncbi:hypothetical protein M413DRAFT_447480 [Hebeloma cylindrosporum]|uniref:DUF1771 domain-containing protein n=1 Tax=Hebeloma cylindrosporum TaxID=76867 RepID=A0A0C3BR76_HEBCY|nr:hypothetical protein M413DRAFT_447480 [Hebeloma cylindrosporum h7]